MKQFLVLSFFGIMVLLLSGCQGLIKEKPIEVIIEGDGQFPEFLVGRWKAEGKSGWEFVFEPDGTISSAVIDNGMVKVKPRDRITIIPMKMGGKGVYKLGQWTVQYTPDNRELAVEVVVKHFHLDMGPNALEGSSEDWFVGRISEDSQIWEAEWSSFPKYIAFTPEPNELTVDPEDYPRGTVVFRKQPENK